MNGVVEIEGLMGKSKEQWQQGEKGVVEERQEVRSE